MVNSTVGPRGVHVSICTRQQIFTTTGPDDALAYLMIRQPFFQPTNSSQCTLEYTQLESDFNHTFTAVGGDTVLIYSAFIYAESSGVYTIRLQSNAPSYAYFLDKTSQTFVQGASVSHSGSGSS